MIQKSIRIGDADVPVIEVNGEEWFPIRTITEKVLLRSGKYGLVNKQNKSKLHIRQFAINYGTGQYINSNCISENELRYLLSNSHVGRLSVEKRIEQNNLHRYLGIDLLPIDEQDTNHYDLQWLDELDGYTKDVVLVEMNNTDWYRRCSKCNLPLPLTNTFYPVHPNAEKGFTKTCKLCLGRTEFFTHPNKDKQMLRSESIELYQAMNDDYLPKILDAYLNGVIKRLPDCYENKESYSEIIKILFKEGVINQDSLTQTLLKDIGLKNVFEYLTIEDVYEMLFGNDFYLYPYKYRKFTYSAIKLTYEIAVQVINNYLKENNLIIEDVLTFDYEELFRKCRISKLTNGNSLSFIVKYHNYKYAGYCFKNNSVHYYKDEKNLLFDLKYLIEKDMKLDINKIPLYLTKNTLHLKSSSLYRWIVTKGNGSLYKWINKLYPGMFNESDFEVNAYRNEFGSDDEMRIHEILKELFGQNVIYNQIHTSRTISIKGMIPDWLVFTDSEVWIIEYFGLYVPRQYGKSSRVTDYIDKTHRKIEEYGKISGYRTLFLYPEDTNDDYLGVRQKIAKMKEM